MFKMTWDSIIINLYLESLLLIEAIGNQRPPVDLIINLIREGPT